MHAQSELISHLVRLNLTDAEIAAQLGVSRQRVQFLVEKMGLPSASERKAVRDAMVAVLRQLRLDCMRHRIWAQPIADRRRNVARLYLVGKTYPAIAAELSIPLHKVMGDVAVMNIANRSRPGGKPIPRRKGKLVEKAKKAGGASA